MITGVELIALAKGLGLSAKIGMLASKGAAMLHGFQLAAIIHSAISSAGFILGGLFVLQMLLIIGGVATTAEAADDAREALREISAGNVKKAFKKGCMAIDKSDGSVTTIVGVDRIQRYLNQN